jgi:hypothetical protein
MGTLAGPSLGYLGIPAVMGGLAQYLFLAQYSFWAAIVGGLVAISVQIIVRLCRGQFRVRLRPIWFLEIAAACVIAGAFAQNWRNAQTDVDVRRERMARWASQTGEMRAEPSDSRDTESEPPIAASATAIIYLGTAVAVVTGLVAIGELIAFLVNLELYLPRRVRESVALGLVVVLLLIVACLVLSLMHGLSLIRAR